MVGQWSMRLWGLEVMREALATQIMAKRPGPTHEMAVVRPD
jgi:hypothetical protein